MPQDQSIPSQPEAPTIETIDEIIRKTAQEGARQLLQQALVAEVEQHLEQHSDVRSEDDRQALVRNGYVPERTIMTGVGPVNVRRPRVDERTAAKQNPKHKRFQSGVLPRFLPRTPTMEGVVATLYLKGLSTNDFDEALRAIYGEDAAKLSPRTVTRLKDVWHDEYEQWRKHKLSSNQYAYIWADGVYFNARIEGDRSCILVIVGAKFKGEKEILAVSAGYPRK